MANISKMKRVVSLIALVGSMFVAGEETYTFTNPNEVGTFTVPNGQYAKAEILLVGGGGAGGTVGQDVVKGAAGGGGAGGVAYREVVLEGGTYYVTVGRGGQKAQNSTASWIGDDGEYTTIALNSSTNFIATVKGGGGGGSVKVGGNGTPGASGGGGSWFGTFMSGGSGTDGYGWNGGTPSDINIGGGGGGAGSTGKADGTPGDGKEVWNVIYARGGRGGNRGEQNYGPKDGEGYGFGGDGAVNGLGGKGGDGIVIVKILKTFTYTDVQIPVDGEQGYTFSSLWSNGVTRVGFDLSKASKELQDGVDSIEGITSVDCHLSGTNMVGVGQYKFTIYLKEEYRWEDGTIGSKTFGWRINEPNVIGNITVDVKKTVDWFEGTNATIAIDIHSTPEKKVFVPNVLYLSGLCNAHGYSAQVAKAAIDAVTEVGNIDYYFYNTVTSTRNVSPTYEGHLNRGQKFNVNSISMQSNNHGPMYGFYTTLSSIVASGKKYDYIIFAFDRTKVATSFPAKHNDEAKIAAWLKPFYDEDKVIWLVDHDPEQCTTLDIDQTPWFPSQLVYIDYGATSSSSGWTTLKGYRTSANTGGATAQEAHSALMALFCPSKYPVTNYQEPTLNNNNRVQSGTTQISRINAMSGTAIKNQTLYDDADECANIIKDVVKPTVATLQAHDQIYIKNGLRINGDLTDAYYTTNSLIKDMTWEEATVNWTKLNSRELTYSDENGIDISISNLTTEVWVKLKVGVTDTGKFLTSVDAKWNERTGKWEKDPNNGPVKVEMLPDNGTKVIAEDEASTTVEWSFEAFKITGEVLYGEGEFIINGFYTNEISVAKGYNPEAMFKGAPGWAVSYIEVDGQVIDESHYMTNWYFGQISADHDIKVAFTNIVKEVPPPEVGPTTYTYDGEGHTIETLKPPTFVEGYEEYSNHWYMVYSTDPDADPTDRSAWTTTPPITNVVYDTNGNPASQTVYSRICLDQPGYEDGAIVPYWCGTNTVTILPREITIEYDDAVQTSNTRVNEFNYHVVDGELVNGDNFNIESGKSGAGKCTNYPNKGNKTEDSVTKGDGLDIISKDGTKGNYVINVIPGDYYYPDLDLVGTAPDVTHVYDGNLYGTEATVVFPIDAKTTPLHQTGRRNGTPISEQDFGTHKTATWTDWTDYWQWTHPNGTTYYHTTSNETSTITTSVSTELKIEYFVDGNWTTTPPVFKEVGEYNVEYRINYTSNIVETTTRNVTIRGNTSTTNTRNIRDVYTTTYTDTKTTTINYNEYVGTAKVTITPRDLTITASSGEKTYDGTPLTNPNYTITGLVDGETITAHMTSDSTITSIGSTSNTVDHNYTHNSKFNPSNYNIKFVDGTLTIVDISNGGGSDDYLDGNALMIVDHDPCTNGWEYLAFDPKFKSTTDVPFGVWLKRTVENNGIKFKYGRTREECDSCNPISIELSTEEKHIRELCEDKIWVKIPLTNIRNVGSFTESLEDGMSFIRIFIEGKANSWFDGTGLAGEGAVSINVHGIAKIESNTSNTMIAIPWTWYSETEQEAEDIPVKKIVKATNLSDGDAVYRASDDGRTYVAWVLDGDEWMPCSTVRVSGLGDIKVVCDEDGLNGNSKSTRVSRGNSIWLIRRHSPENPIWVYGQSVLTKVVTSVNEPSDGDAVMSTTLANPYMKPIMLNELNFTGTSSTTDRIWYYNQDGTIKDIMYVAGKGWRMATTMEVNGKVRTVYDYDIEIPAGIGFWYDRRGTSPITINW